MRARIPLSACLEVFASPTIVDDFYSSAINARTTAKKYVCILCVCVSMLVTKIIVVAIFLCSFLAHGTYTVAVSYIDTL